MCMSVICAHVCFIIYNSVFMEALEFHGEVEQPLGVTFVLSQWSERKELIFQSKSEGCLLEEGLLTLLTRVFFSFY